MVASTDKICNMCNSILEPLVNWTAGQIKSQSNICKKCKNVKSEKWRRDNGILEKQLSQKYSAKWHEKKKIANIQYWKDNPKKKAYHSYNQNAKNRNIPFNLTYNDFLKFDNENCYYCGSEVTTLSGIGVDRLDNKRGYEIGNIVSCCSQCNWMKSDLTIDAFISHCKKIIKEVEKWQVQRCQIS